MVIKSNRTIRDNEMFRLLSKYARVNAIYFVSICTSTYRMEHNIALNFEMSLSKGAHAQLSNMPHQDTI